MPVATGATNHESAVCRLAVTARGLGWSIRRWWEMTVSDSSASVGMTKKRVGMTMALLRPHEVMKMGRRLPVRCCACRAYPPPHPTVGTGLPR